ncbi:MAG: hypothetical protein IJ945_02230 [Oscillospiraceae bacterium]|nr:hypothetical protein [Oscillospiraceae bacterium]
MICPNCGKNLPEDSIFCTACGCNLAQFEKTEPKAEAPAQQYYQNPPEQAPVPQYYAYPNPPVSPKQEKKASQIVPWVLLGVALIASVVAFIYAMTLQNSNSEYRREIENNQIRLAQLEREADAKDSELEDLEEELALVNEELALAIEDRDLYEDASEIFFELLDFMKTEDSWGYCTENFHADKGIMVIDRMSGKQELRIFSTYYATFTFEVSNDSVIDVKWSDKEWTEKETQIYITPKDYGIATITLTNDLYDNSFSVLVIVI